MNKGIIYFIQPHEFVGTDIYKVGMSEKTGYKRGTQGYKKIQKQFVFLNAVILRKLS